MTGTRGRAADDIVSKSIGQPQARGKGGGVLARKCGSHRVIQGVRVGENGVAAVCATFNEDPKQCTDVEAFIIFFHLLVLYSGSLKYMKRAGRERGKQESRTKQEYEGRLRLPAQATKVRRSEGVVPGLREREGEAVRKTEDP